MEPFTIALGGHACRVCAYADLYVDRHAASEARHVPPVLGKILQDPSDSDIELALREIPGNREIRVLTSLQGIYSITTLPKVLLPLRTFGRQYSIEILPVHREIEKHLAIPKIYLGQIGRPVPADQFDVAISYASEDRAIAERIARELISLELNVFYDRENQALVLGRDLEQRLHEIYAREARLCLLLLSQHYVGKKYTMIELRAAMERYRASTSAFLVPIKLDNTNVPELPQSVVYADLGSGDEAAIRALVDEIAKMRPTISWLRRTKRCT